MSKTPEKERPVERGWGDPEHHPIDFDATSGRKQREDKREYIFSFSKAKRCDHPTLRIVARGTSLYRCHECNYCYWLPTATMWPLHWRPIIAAMEIMSFVKEFGVGQLEKVYRTPIGQLDGTPHKAILPEGKSFVDVLAELDQVDSAKLGPIVPFPEALAFPAESHGNVENGKVLPSPKRRKALVAPKEAHDNGTGPS